MQAISVHNKVRHLTDAFYNTLEMEVLEVNENKILCNYTGRDGNLHEKEFDVSEIQKIGEGFKPEFF